MRVAHGDARPAERLGMGAIGSGYLFDTRCLRARERERSCQDLDIG